MPRRSKARRAAEAALAKLYDSLPTIACNGACHRTCGPAPFAELEVVLIDEYRVAHGIPTPVLPQRVVACPWLTSELRCAVHPRRPLVCRMFGVVDHPMMLCQWGCKPSRLLTQEEGQKVLKKYDEICRRLDEAERQ